MQDWHVAERLLRAVGGERGGTGERDKAERR